MLLQLETRIVQMCFENKYCNFKDTILCLSLVGQFIKEG